MPCRAAALTAQVAYASRERQTHPSNQNTNQRRGNHQPQQVLAQSTGGRAQQGRSLPQNQSSRPTSSSQHKSVKFADLTDKEMAQLRAEGRCFLCKGEGHMSRNCPTRNSVKGNRGKKPPGVSSYSMDMAFIEDFDEGAPLETLPVGFLEVGPSAASSENWRKWYPTWQNPEALAPE